MTGLPLRLRSSLMKRPPKVFSLHPDVRDVRGIEGTSFGPLMDARIGLDTTREPASRQQPWRAILLNESKIIVGFLSVGRNTLIISELVVCQKT